MHSLLVQEWRGFHQEDGFPHVFPADRGIISADRYRDFSSFEEYILSFEFGDDKDTRFHLGLLPIPYIGSLDQASVFILMLNPGLSPGDYFAETEYRTYRECLVRNIHQDQRDEQYPFLFLNPELAWHPGFEYWESKLRGVAQGLAYARGCTYQEALQALSEEIACLELIPYHSRNFGAPKSLITSLQSTNLILDYVHNVLLPRAYQDEVIIVTTRSAHHWALEEESKSVIVYKGSEARAAHLSLNSRGGQAIADRLGL